MLQQHQPSRSAGWSPRGGEQTLQVVPSVCAQTQTNIASTASLPWDTGATPDVTEFPDNLRCHGCSKLPISSCLMVQIERAFCNSPLLTSADAITQQNLNTGTLPSPLLAHTAYQTQGITPDLALSSRHDVNFTCFIKQQHVESNSNAGHIKHVTHRAIKDCLKLSFKVQSASCRKNETSVAQRIKLCIA